MTIFVIFILVGLTLGTGTMLAPALATRQPRIGVSGVFSFGVVLSGAIFWGAAFGWDTLAVDYLWFALIIGIFLGGTLTVGMKRLEEAKAAGIDGVMGWPGVRTLGFFFLWLAIVTALLWREDFDSQLKGTSGLQVKSEALQTSNRLSILQELPGDGAPGVPTLLSYLDQQLPARAGDILRALSATLLMLLLWQLHDLGREASIHEKWVWAGIVLTTPAALWMRTETTLLLALNFYTAFVFFTWRWSRHFLYFDAFAAAVCATAAILTIPAAVYPILGLYILLTLVSRPRDATAGEAISLSWVQKLPSNRIVRWVVVPLMMLIGLSPWLASL